MIKRLKEARLRVRLTQVEVAQKLKKPQSYISKTENGERRIDATELASLAKVYKKDVNFFLN
ncbi:helix-turn-helix transcriptional regulator [Patescibacteria group bacterium]|nr:helix-turn-helix transcriptional regulator [Patescibacteria group bacterium]